MRKLFDAALPNLTNREGVVFRGQPRPIKPQGTGLTSSVYVSQTPC